MREHPTQLEAELLQLRSLRDEGNIDRRLYNRMLREIEKEKREKTQILANSQRKYT